MGTANLANLTNYFLRMKVLLTLSILVNLGLTYLVVDMLFSGTGEVRNGKFGILKEDIKVGLVGTDKEFFSLPKGLVVRDVHETGAGWFENNRFRIVVTSEREDLVDYSEGANITTSHNNELYSADLNTEQNAE